MLIALLQATPIPDVVAVIQSGESGGSIDWLNVAGAVLAIFLSAFGGTYFGHLLSVRRDHRNAVKEFRIAAIETIAHMLKNPTTIRKSRLSLNADYTELRKQAQRTGDAEIIRLVEEMHRRVLEADSLTTTANQRLSDDEWQALVDAFKATEQLLNDKIESKLLAHFS